VRVQVPISVWAGSPVPGWPLAAVVAEQRHLPPMAWPRALLLSVQATGEAWAWRLAQESPELVAVSPELVAVSPELLWERPELVAVSPELLWERRA
jgi:hypothetical protein